jgi:hypothetical protein
MAPLSTESDRMMISRDKLENLGGKVVPLSFNPHIFTHIRVVVLVQGPFSLVSTIEKLLGRNSNSSGLEIRECGHRDLSRWPCGTLYPQIVVTNFAEKRRSLGIVCLWTQAM